MSDETNKLHRYAIKEIREIENRNKKRRLILQRRAIMSMMWGMNTFIYLYLVYLGVVPADDQILFFLVKTTGVVSGTACFSVILDMLSMARDFVNDEMLKKSLEQFKLSILKYASDTEDAESILDRYINQTEIKIARENIAAMTAKDSGLQMIVMMLFCASLLLEGNMGAQEIANCRLMGIFFGSSASVPLMTFFQSLLKRQELKLYLDSLTENKECLKRERKLKK